MKILNEPFNFKNTKQVVIIIIVIVAVYLLFYFNRFDLSSVPSALFYYLILFIFCIISVAYLYAKNGGSDRFAYFTISLMLTLSAVMLFSLLFNLSNDSVEKPKVDAYFLTSEMPAKEAWQVVLFYARDISSLIFAALGVSSMAAAIRENNKPIINSDITAVASVNSQNSINELEIEDFSKNQYFDICEKNKINVNDNLLFAIIAINIYLIIKKDK
jgi:hypothetical protein